MKDERIKWWADYFTSYGHEGILPEQVEKLAKEAQAEQRERDAARLERAILTIVAGDVLGSTVKEALHGIAKAIRDE